MKVSELMTGVNVITAPPETPVLDARSRMLEERIRHLLVTEDGRLVGIVTDRDIRLNLPSQATSLSVWEINHLLTKLTVGEVMTRTVITIGPDRDARDAAELMLDHSIGALPVTDGGGADRHHHRDRHPARVRVADGWTGGVSSGAPAERLTGTPVKVLALNCGSSSVKFQLFAVGERRRREASPIGGGLVERIGGPRPISSSRRRGDPRCARPAPIADHEVAVRRVIDWIRSEARPASMRSAIASSTAASGSSSRP